MSDEQPVPETLETVAAGIRDLRSAMDARFVAVDKRFDELRTEIAGVRSQLQAEIAGVRSELGDEIAGVRSELGADIAGVKSQLKLHIEAVHADVRRVAEGFGAHVTRNEQNDRDHEAFDKRLDDHDSRLLALERKNPA